MRRSFRSHGSKGTSAQRLIHLLRWARDTGQQRNRTSWCWSKSSARSSTWSSSVPHSGSSMALTWQQRASSDIGDRGSEQIASLRASLVWPAQTDLHWNQTSVPGRSTLVVSHPVSLHLVKPDYIFLIRGVGQYSQQSKHYNLHSTASENHRSRSPPRLQGRITTRTNKEIPMLDVLSRWDSRSSTNSEITHEMQLHCQSGWLLERASDDKGGSVVTLIGSLNRNLTIPEIHWASCSWDWKRETISHRELHSG